MARLPIQVEVIIFRTDKGKHEYLMLKRIPSRGGFWQPVTGGQEEGEEMLDTVKRELREETGITEIKRIIEGVYEYIVDEEPYPKEYIFGAEISPTTKVSIDKNVYPEHEEHRWCSYKEAMKLLKWPGNKTGLTKLKKIIENEKN